MHVDCVGEVPQLHHRQTKLCWMMQACDIRSVLVCMLSCDAACSEASHHPDWRLHACCKLRMELELAAELWQLMLSVRDRYTPTSVSENVEMSECGSI